MKKITMLGTGNALVTKCYNTCFTIQTDETLLLVDGGGGNGILTQLERANIKLDDIHQLFITHAHTDHIIGVLWVVRVYIQHYLRGFVTEPLHVYGHDKSLMVLRTMCELMLHKKHSAQLGNSVILHEIKDGEDFKIGDIEISVFDIQSTKEKQFGFHAKFADETRLCCLGDEPYNPNLKKYAENADWLLSEAFCLYDERDKFKPYEKNHSTVKDVAELAATLNVPNLLLYHTEDTHITERKELYSAEARQYYQGNIFVPNDLETIGID